MLGRPEIKPDGLWSALRAIFVRVHATERFFERGGEDLSGALYGADERVTARHWYELEDREVLVAAAGGAFIGEVAAPGEFVGRTWVRRDRMKSRRQRAWLDQVWEGICGRL
jgi:hypothetical protein